MNPLEPPSVEPGRLGAVGDWQWRPILLGALAAMVLSGAVVTAVAAIGTMMAQVTAVVTTANAESAARHAQAHAPATCGLASR